MKCWIFVLVFCLRYHAHALSDQVCNVFDQNEKAREYYCDGPLLNFCVWNSTYLMPSDVSGVKRLKFRGCETDSVVNVIKQFPQITELDISYSNYESLSWLNMEMRHLDKLNASHNKLVDVPFGLFTKMPAIKEIDLSYNKFEEIKNTVFFPFGHLSWIHLSNNRISRIARDSFTNLTELAFIDLSNNKIATISGLFRKCSNLRTIHLEHNPINGFYEIDRPPMWDAIYVSWQDSKHIHFGAPMVKQAHIIVNSGEEGLFKSSAGVFEWHFNEENLKNVETFYAEVNTIENVLSVVQYLGLSLKALHIFGNHIGHIPIDSFQHLSNLQSLILSDVNLAEFDTNLINSNNQPILMALDISSNNLKFINNAPAFVEFKNLKFLNLTGNQITDMPKIIQYLPSSIESMHLCDNFVGEIDATTFSKFKQLSKLNIKNTSLSLLREDPFELFADDLFLDISYNDLSNLNFTLLANTLSRLSSFKVAGCGITNTSEILKLLSPRVSSIDFSDNPFGEINANTFHRINQLSFLKLRNASLSSFTITDQQHLIKLDISNNNLKHLEVLANDAQRINIYHFHVEGNDLTELPEFIRLNPLRSLAISNNQFSCEYLASIVPQLKRKWSNIRFLGDPWKQKHGENCQSNTIA